MYILNITYSDDNMSTSINVQYFSRTLGGSSSVLGSLRYRKWAPVSKKTPSRSLAASFGSSDKI